ncbi:MAG: adenylosuccinate lyase, partial [Clostridia bacterium]|nr:adenylosuccinate lyase [Clostridia bacterium]
LEHMIETMNRIVRDLNVYPENMERSMRMSYDLPYSQQVLLTLIGSGMLRETAYDLVQKCAMQAWQEQRSFKELLLSHPDVRAQLTEEEILRCFELSHHLKHVNEIYRRLGLTDTGI